MFLCSQCHYKTGCKRLHLFNTSYGACEACGKITNCVDCSAKSGRTVVTGITTKDTPTISVITKDAVK